MGKIDTSLIEGYADMTPEQKIAALESMELAEPDYSGYVKKDVFDKTASDLAKMKKDSLARMSEEERAKRETEEELEQLRARNKELERNATVSSYKAKYLAMGFDDKLAEETAQAWADGNQSKVIDNTAAFLAAHDKVVKADMLGKTPLPPAGSGVDTITREQIEAIKDDEQRVLAMAKHIELFQ